MDESSSFDGNSDIFVTNTRLSYCLRKKKEIAEERQCDKTEGDHSQSLVGLAYCIVVGTKQETLSYNEKE